MAHGWQLRIRAMAAHGFAGAALISCGAALHAADVGGYFADQQKSAAMASTKVPADGCMQQIARAPGDASGVSAYGAALCYLQADTPDTIAAKAWLMRSSELGFMPAHRLLRNLQIAEAGVHGPAPHCHSLGEGRQLCHGGAAPLPVAAAAP
jgi:hypothetical protein